MSFSGRRLFLETPNEIRGGQKTSCCPLRHGKSAAIHIPLPRIAGLDDRGLAQPHADAPVLCTLLSSSLSGEPGVTTTFSWLGWRDGVSSLCRTRLVPPPI